MAVLLVTGLLAKPRMGSPGTIAESALKWGCCSREDCYFLSNTLLNIFSAWSPAELNVVSDPKLVINVDIFRVRNNAFKILSSLIVLPSAEFRFLCFLATYPASHNLSEIFSGC